MSRIIHVRRRLLSPFPHLADQHAGEIDHPHERSADRICDFGTAGGSREIETFAAIDEAQDDDEPADAQMDVGRDGAAAGLFEHFVMDEA